MKTYKLLKDLPTFKAGTICRITQNGNLITKEECISAGRIVYRQKELQEFPNILKDWFEEIPEQPKTVWDLKDGDIFYYIETSGEIVPEEWTKLWLDERDCGVCFLTREEAENDLARRKAKQILLRDTKGFKASIENSRFYYVRYDIYDHTFDVGCWETDCCGGELVSPINFATRDDAEASIKAHEKEWKMYLGVEE